MSVAMDQRPSAGKLKTALVLASIAAVFFFSVIVRHWLW
jgi:hypothetical protein